MPIHYLRTIGIHRLVLLLASLIIGFTNATSLSSNQYNSRTANEGSWIRNSLIGQGPRQEHSVTSIGSNVYIIGGVAYDQQSEIETLNRVEYFNTADQTWHVAAPLPIPLNHGNAATVDDKMYVLGSLSGGHNWKAQAATFVYQPFNDTWSNLTSMPDARGSSAVGVYKSKIYLAGGMTLLEAYKGGHQNSQATVTSYDTESDTWDTDYSPLPEPRQHVGYSVVGSIFYVIGGRENGVYQYHNTTYAMDLDNPTHWTTLAPMPTARGSLSCAPIGHKIYCFGGEGNRENADRIFNETQVYDTISDTWKTLKPMEVPRHGFGVAAVGDRIYVPGGGVTTAFDPTGINDMFVPDLEE